jgi:competence protein ComEA
MNGNRKLLSAFLFFAWLAGWSIPATAQGLPDGPGKAALEASCTLCHGLNYITQSSRSASDWRDLVSDMVSRGAPLTLEEFEMVLQYLPTHFGPRSAAGSASVNANRASARELETALGISTREAEAIVRYRQQNPAFRTVEDVKKVPGIDAQKIEAGKDRLTF